MYCMMCGGKLCDGANFCHQCGANVPVIEMPCTKETGRKGKASDQEMVSEEINNERRSVTRSKLRQQVKELKEEVKYLKDELEKKAQAAKEQEDESLFSDELKNEGDGQDAIIGYDQDQHLDMNYRELRTKYDELKATENDLKGENKKHLKEHEKLSNELSNIKDELNMKNLRIQELHKETENVKREKNEELARISRLTEQNKSDGNTNITDLSDPNGPSKLGEIYSQLYENEWTDAFEVLTEIFYLDDTSAIHLLLTILLESSKHASDTSQAMMTKIEGFLYGSSEEASPDCKRLLREARKLVDITKANGFLQDFQEKLTVELKYHREEKLATYMNRCFQLCWLMSIQDPPVVPSSDPVKGDKFDTNLYKCYTHSICVWPALLLCKGGPILAKGVAEPFTIPRVKSAPNVRLEENGISFGRGGQMEYGDKRQVSTAKGVAEPFILSTSNGNPSIAKSEATKDVSFDRGSQTKYDGKIRDSTSGSDRMRTTYYAKNASFSSESVSKVTPQHPTHESKDRRVHSATPTMSKKSGIKYVPKIVPGRRSHKQL